MLASLWVSSVGIIVAGPREPMTAMVPWWAIISTALPRLTCPIVSRIRSGPLPPVASMIYRGETIHHIFSTAPPLPTFVV